MGLSQLGDVAATLAEAREFQSIMTEPVAAEPETEILCAISPSAIMLWRTS
jgi:hypothetical protein